MSHAGKDPQLVVVFYVAHTFNSEHPVEVSDIVEPVCELNCGTCLHSCIVSDAVAPSLVIIIFFMIMVVLLMVVLY